ncbi:hypothetical protein MHBO_003382 [Bonamia ostreae]|uniref:Tetratricopeptide repeat protein n=1 Tax=Bonamia ostreae TaxID=126728 RepID=A0ABV2AQ93_9EUKA
MMDTDIAEMRNKVFTSKENLQLDSALFFSEKLVLFSDEFEDTKNHCHIMLALSKFRELLFFLRKKNLLINFVFPENQENKSLSKATELIFFHLIAAKCYNKIKKYSDAIEVLNENAKSGHEIIPNTQKFFFVANANFDEATTKFKKAIF